jgi:peptidoglycan/xylan/chitin deacetylase (PgdA/CDA1 family)
MPITASPAVYLTFDDGPHETATPFVLDTLKQYNVKATFFCIGKNVVAHPDIYNRILQEGHAVGNHTHNHLNGWKTPTASYLNNISLAEGVIDSKLFRPPYGKITFNQSKYLRKAVPAWTIIMWDVLSGDFDVDITPEQCLKNVTDKIEPGSIVVFHDSAKAWDRMSYALPKVLEYCKSKGWQVAALPKNL